MPLTRGDKMIIIGAVALAVTVVLGLAILKKPYLFTGGAKSQPADIAPAPTAASAPEAAPIAAPATQVPAVVATPAPAPSPAAVSPAPAGPSAAPAAAPAPAAVTAPATTQGVGSKPAPATAGDETLEKMFAEIAGDAASAGKPGEPKAAVPQGATGGDVKEPVTPAVPGSAPTPAPAPEPAAAPVEAKPEPKGKAAKAAARAAAKAEAKAKAEAAKAAKAKPASAPDVPPGPAPETHSAQPPIDKAAAAKPVAPAKKAATPAEAAKPQAGVAAGNVVRIVAEEKPGEYVLLIQTNKPPASFNKMFMADPPRMVLDLGGAWNYNGPLSSATGNDFIRHIRVGKHADMFRVVLDMAPDATTRLRGAPTATRVPEGVELRIPK